jgi:tetratricopeptide (TPR) repeat protein
VLIDSGDKTARLWDTGSGQLLNTLGEPTTPVELGDTQVLIASNDKTARIWRIFPTTQALMDYARKRLPRYLTVQQREQFFLPVDEALREAEKLLAEGEGQAQKGEVETAIATFKQALHKNPHLGFDPKLKARVLAATSLLAQGEHLAQSGDLEASTAIFSQVKALSENFSFDPKARAESIHFPRVTPKQVAPADGTTLDRGPRQTTLTWEPVAGATHYTVEIVLCQSEGKCEEAPRVVSDLTTTSYAVELTGTPSARWRVWAVDTDGQKSAQSEWWTFSSSP